MPGTGTIFDDLDRDELARVHAHAVHHRYAAGELLFSAGDPVDYIYFIEQGTVSIFIQRFSSEEEISVLGPGDCFGEMAVFYKDRRTASARTVSDTIVLSLEKQVFLELVREDPGIAEKIHGLLARRNEELVLKESLMDSTGIDGRRFRVSIKGDPSLRESAFTRERYDSVVDPILPELIDQLEELLLRRDVLQLFVHFNSGEIRTTSVFDPFREDAHPAIRIADAGYVERHFPALAYGEKVALVRRMYDYLSRDDSVAQLPGLTRRVYTGRYENWQPLTTGEVRNAIRRLPELRTLPNFYLRNFTVSMARDAIRMQFNCDGTHIVSADDYNRFLDENLI